MKKFNLSIVINDNTSTRLDLMTASLKEIDSFTTKFDDSNKVKAYFKDKINEYLLRNYVKGGALVITYQDEDSNYIRRLRVLYKDEKTKINIEKMPQKIKQALNKHNDARTTLDVIKRFTPYIFGNNYERNLIYNNEYLIGYNKERDSKINKLLTNNIIYNNLFNSLNTNPDIGYFKTRLIDSYLHRIGIETIEKKSTNIDIKVQNIETLEKAKLKKENPCENKDAKFEPVGDYYQEGDGQLNLFDNVIERPRVRIQDLYEELRFERR